MTTSTVFDDLEIAPGTPGAPGYTLGCWKHLKLNPDAPNSADWNKAVEIIDARIRRRFLDPVDSLIEFEKNRSHWTFGFTILAIDFLVIETLQGFCEGQIVHSEYQQKGREGGGNKGLFTAFLNQWDAFQDCVPQKCDSIELAQKIYRGYRCELHHSGATEGAFRVLACGKMFNFKNDHEVTINRTCLHKNLKHEFDAYLADLRKVGKNDLRCNFIKKMNAICGL